jgi:hypothetical protein
MLRGYLLIAAGKNKTVSFSSFMKEGAKFLGALSGIPMVPCDCYKTHERKGASATRGNYPRNTRRVLQMYCTQLPSMPSMCQGQSRLRRYHLRFLPRAPCLAKCSEPAQSQPQWRVAQRAPLSSVPHRYSELPK